MMNMKLRLLSLAVSSALVAQSGVAVADAVTNALTSGKASVDMRLRYEKVDQDTANKDADAMTLRTRLSYTTGAVDGFSTTLGMADVRVVADIDEYNDATFGEYADKSVIADPETTELDQAYLQYKTAGCMARAGRQVITLDGHRFVGHVGWRQNRQTFDGLSLAFNPSKALTLKYIYISERNRIFAEEKDVDAADNLLNLTYKTPLGTLTGYAYLLTEDKAGAAADVDIDTFGLSFKGAAKSGNMKFLYALEYADQERDVAGASSDADYMLLEGGVVASGITAKLGLEVLGSDNGGYGFGTPLATLHKFNGWSDQFLGTPNEGLEDMYLSLSTKLAGGKLAFIYHDYSTDQGTATGDDMGDEINILYARKYGKNYSAGIKYASYSKATATVSGGDSGASDTDKLWVWVGAKF